ncbi:MAG: hydrogenase maturation nickel metallochaperone HypA [Acidobacteriaceae bacterium]
MASAAHSSRGYNARSRHDAWTRSGVREASREARIARAILAMAKAEASCLGGAQLLRVGVNVGADCDIDIPALEDALKLIRHDTGLEGIVIHLSLCPRIYCCDSCGREYASESSLQRCVECGSADCSLMSGDELELAFIEVARR